MNTCICVHGRDKERRKDEIVEIVKRRTRGEMRNKEKRWCVCEQINRIFLQQCQLIFDHQLVIYQCVMEGSEKHVYVSGEMTNTCCGDLTFVCMCAPVYQGVMVIKSCAINNQEGS